jgi:[ribosomal protein S18]-alanine N-acetyltransferase
MRWWDIDAVMPLERSLFPVDPWSAAGFWSELAGVPATRTYVVAESDGEVIGYAGLFSAGDAADVQTIGVRADQQGRGLGATLLEGLVAEARRRGASALLLEVRADNAAALALYQRHGFERLALRRGYYGPGRDAVVMRRRLTS